MALAIVAYTEERQYEPELYRLKGELLFRIAAKSRAREASRSSEAAQCLRQALDIASRRHAKSLELRAALSLARVAQRRGKRAEARECLAPVYRWFTEGFDTADLREAKTLLEEVT
jgi:adenylate cyclase